MRGSRRLFPLLGATALMLAMVAVTSTSAHAASTNQKVVVKAFEYGFRTAPSAAAAGKITFSVKNIGGEKHEMVLVRTEPGVPLPTKANGTVNEKAIPKADHFGEVENIKPNKAKSLTRTLPAGSYVVFCNLVDKAGGTTRSHYDEGMQATITVS